MPRVTWNDLGKREYSTGLDRGMIYDRDNLGHAWDGLISVKAENKMTVESINYDGTKLKDIAIVGAYEGGITAYQYPEALDAMQGTAGTGRTGAYLTGQDVSTFCMSYRTKHGNDVDGLVHYKLHIVYNVTAIPKVVEHNTISDDVDAIEFEWDIYTVPERAPGSRPTAHIILDSKKLNPDLLSDIEDILYGYDYYPPTCPSLKAILSLLDTWDRLIIIDNDDGTWTAIINKEDDYTDLGSEEFELDAENVLYLDSDTYELSSSSRITDDVQTIRFVAVDNDDGTWTAIINNEDDYTDLGSEEFEIDTVNVVYLDADTYEFGSSS